jgi:hypothetical protein
MVLFDVGFSFVAAGTMAWRAKGTRPDLPLVFTGCGLAPVGLIFLERYPAWDWQYLVDPATVPDIAPALFVGAIGVAAVAGHKVGSRSVKPIAVAAGLLGLFCLVLIKQMLFVGTYAEFHAGGGIHIPMEFIVFAVPWLTLGGGVLGACLWAAERTGRDLRRAAKSRG